MQTTGAWRRVAGVGLALGATLLFVLLATLNSGGYRYGVSDQAFYIPAIRHHLDPQLFPRDWPMMASQDQLNVFTAAAALAARMTGVSLPVLFLLTYLATLVILFWAIVALGRALFRSWWTVATLAAAMTLRHRVIETGVNTLEGYLHPRMLAFAVGTAGVAVFLRGRMRLALALAIAAALVHPTTGVWFCVWVGVAAWVSDQRTRTPLAVGAIALGAAAAAWIAWSGIAGALFTRMDATWLSALATKDYLFPSAWHAWAWVLMLAYPVLVVLLYQSRVRAGVAGARERGLVAGSLVLFAALLVSLPFIGAHFATAVRLQMPRVLWMIELLVTASLVWWLVERPSRARGGAPIPRHRLVVVCVIALFAATRGTYVTFVEHPGRPVVQMDLAADAWRDAMEWLARTPPSAHVLADPGHAWKYGSSVRAAAGRDVFQEEAKDAAFALYSRATAMRFLARIGEIGDFQQMSAARARELAVKHDLDYLVAERPLGLPVVYRNARFAIYGLRSP